MKRKRRLYSLRFLFALPAGAGIFYLLCLPVQVFFIVDFNYAAVIGQNIQ